MNQKAIEEIKEPKAIDAALMNDARAVYQLLEAHSEARTWFERAESEAAREERAHRGEGETYRHTVATVARFWVLRYVWSPTTPTSAIDVVLTPLSTLWASAVGEFLAKRGSLPSVHESEGVKVESLWCVEKQERESIAALTPAHGQGQE